MSNEYDRFNSWKGLAYADKLREISDGKMPNPVNWHVYASNLCPYSCNFCIMKTEHDENYLSKKTLEKIVQDAKKLDVKLVHISGGGEPLTNPYINDFVKGLNQNNIKIAMSTNGYLLDRLTEPIDHLRVSFNAGTRDSYKSIHGAYFKDDLFFDAFDKTIHNIKNAKKKNIAKDIGMGFVLTDENYHEVDEFVRIAEDCNVDFVHIRPAYIPEKNEKIKDAMRFAERPKSDKLDVFMTSDKFDGYWTKDKYPCKATPLHAVTAATGEFLLCQDRLDLRFGDYNVQSFEDIWHSDEHKRLIEKAQDCNIRCVESGLNKMIEKAFVNNDLRLELI